MREKRKFVKLAAAKAAASRLGLPIHKVDFSLCTTGNTRVNWYVGTDAEFYAQKGRRGTNTSYKKTRFGSKYDDAIVPLQLWIGKQSESFLCEDACAVVAKAIGMPYKYPTFEEPYRATLKILNELVKNGVLLKGSRSIGKGRNKNTYKTKNPS